MSGVPASQTTTVIGYARVSTVTQTLEQQTEQLTTAGAGKIFHDVMSGARDDRPGFAECLGYLRGARRNGPITQEAPRQDMLVNLSRRRGHDLAPPRPPSGR